MTAKTATATVPYFGHYEAGDAKFYKEGILHVAARTDEVNSAGHDEFYIYPSAENGTFVGERIGNVFIDPMKNIDEQLEFWASRH